jgi:uncharacterized protein
MTQPHKNPFLLAADNSPELLPLLRRRHSLASAQDDHGYSLLHAAASYNHLDLLRSLLVEFNVPVDLKDGDGETALFVCETVECARVLVEEFHASITVRGEDGKTARERMEAEGDFPEVATYLLIREGIKEHSEHSDVNDKTSQANIIGQAPPLPEGLSIDIGTMAPEDIGDEVVDPGLKRRIDELAARGDFQGEEGQRQLRELITEAVRGQIVEDREVRQRIS